MKFFPMAEIVVGAIICGTAFAGDSPQFRGPNRDGSFDEFGLLKSWPDGSPHVLWAAEGLGRGFSSASVANGKVYVTGMQEDQTGNLYVLNDDGTLAARIPYGMETVEKQATGSRSTPTIDGERAYLLSGLGTLYCIDLAAGTTAWQVNILERFGGENSQWHLAESPLVDGDRVICTPGGPDATLVALDKMTGETIWTTNGVNDRASYCSPTIFTHGERRILTTVTGSFVIGADANTGDLLWTFEHHAPYDIHAVTPLYSNGLLYYVGGDGTGGGALELSPDGTAVVSKWTDTHLDCLHHGVVLVDGYLYGTGYKGGGKLVCLEMATGKLMWSSDEVQLADVVYADGMLYTYEGPKSGVVSLVKAIPTGFERTGQFTVDRGNYQHWAHPTIANGRLYIRHGDVLIAYDVTAQ